jgi:hypothetical protein
MHRAPVNTRAARRQLASTFLVVGAVALLGIEQPAVAQGVSAMSKAAAAPKEEELPHPFFTHMGLPEGVGNFNLRLLGIATRTDSKTDGDFAFHLETGLTKNIGLHIRNDRFLNNAKTEAMFQYTALISKDGMSGFAPIIEFEFPTHSGASRINTLVGFTSSLGASRWAFNQVLHYDPREDMVDASAALVVGASRYVFPVVELLGEGGKGQSSVVDGLAGLKVRLRDWLIGGVAIRLPITRAQNFSSQLALGPDIEWKR